MLLPRGPVRSRGAEGEKRRPNKGLMGTESNGRESQHNPTGELWGVSYSSKFPQRQGSWAFICPWLKVKGCRPYGDAPLWLSASVLKVAQVSLRSPAKKSYRHCLQDTKAQQRWKMGVWLKKNREERGSDGG